MGEVFDAIRRAIHQPYSFRDNQELGEFLKNTLRNLCQCINNGFPKAIAFDKILEILHERAEDLSNK